jgi:hypothetical protein
MVLVCWLMENVIGARKKVLSIFTAAVLLAQADASRDSGAKRMNTSRVRTPLRIIPISKVRHDECWYYFLRSIYADKEFQDVAQR